jgi:hypothetical protein
VKFQGSITLHFEEATPEEFAAKLIAAGAIGTVSHAMLNPRDSLGSYGNIGQAAGAYVAPVQPPAEAPAEAPAEGKPTRGRPKKTVESSPAPAAQGAPAEANSPTQAPADGPTAGQETTASGTTASASPSDTAPVPELTQLRAAASEKIGADPANRAKVHAIIAQFSADKAEPAMSKIPEGERIAALTALEAL